MQFPYVDLFKSTANPMALSGFLLDPMCLYINFSPDFLELDKAEVWLHKITLYKTLRPLSHI